VAATSASGSLERVICRVLLVAGVVFLAGCAVGERPTLTGEGLDDVESLDGGAVAATVGAGAEPATTVADDPALDDLAALGDAPAVVVTSTGVVVPVLGRSEAGYAVRTPCGNDAEIVWGQPIGPVDVVLDPGHGGDEQGALGPSGQTEAEVNLDIARRAAVALEQRGFSVALTRTADYRITIPNRAAIANRLAPGALISIHHNSPSPDISEERSTPGTEVYTQVASEDSTRLGGLVYEDVVAALSVFDAEWASRTDAGVLRVVNDSGQDAYGIVRRPEAPAVLVELAYLSNPTEAVVIGTGEYRQAAAEAIANALARFLSTADVGAGFVAEPRLFNPSADTGGSDGCVDPLLS